jgi:YbgC/YbaW family acyl-CoA thioester hydrolase
MARIKLSLPHTFTFSTNIKVRITDINYGGHVGNDSFLSLIHEARVQFLTHYGYNEINFAGVGLIMSDVAIEFKTEAFYGDELRIDITANDFSRVSFDLVYKFSKKSIEGSQVIVAVAKTGMICYDYGKKKVVGIPDEANIKLTQ